MKTLLSLSFLLIFAIGFSYGQSLPPFPGMRLQGSLTNTLGEPIEGTHSVTVRIYKQLSGGIPVYTEFYGGLTISKGILDVIVNVSGLPFDSLYWAETQLDNEVFAPRTQLLSVPYAFHAFKADTAMFVKGFLPLTGGVMTGAITNTGNPPITMGKGNFGTNNINIGADGFVAGGNNKTRGNYSVIAGGGGQSDADSNSITSDYSFIGGGKMNKITQEYSVISGGMGNLASGQISTISGGNGNISEGLVSTVGGGSSNRASGQRATVGGGGSNNALGIYSTVAGGSTNLASGVGAFVGGGGFEEGPNISSGDYSTVSGGMNNRARGGSTVIAGGGWYGSDSNSAMGDYCVISGGRGNISGLLPYTDVVIGGGRSNKAMQTGCTIGGGENNQAGNLGYGHEGHYATVSGGYGNVALGWATFVGGGTSNTAGNGVGNGVTTGSVVVGGNYNNAWGNYSSIGGGGFNFTNGFYCTVSGGNLNQAGGGPTPGNQFASVGGGQNDTALGNFSTVPGGSSNMAYGSYTFAAGQQAKAFHDGAFVWADNSNADFSSTTTNQFNIRATGGTRIFSNSGLTAGVTLAPGASAWASVSDSTKKRNARLVDGADILEKVSRLPIKQWSYKAQDASIEHIGPMAQDFYALFGLGDNDKTISTIDPSGVALAAIQQLQKENNSLADRVNQLEFLVKSLLDAKQSAIVKTSNEAK